MEQDKEEVQHGLWNGTRSPTPFEPLYNTGLDTTIAVLIIACFVCGSALNAITMLYFGKLVRRDISVRRDKRTSKKLLYNGLYFLNSINDFLICFTILPVSVSFLKDRSKAWFGSKTFCTIWGALWEILPYLSIMYVMVLSLTRTFHLLLPLRHIRLRIVALIWTIYTLFCAGRSFIPAFTKLGVYTFHPDSVYCFEWARLRYGSYVRFAEYSDVIQLGVPILPILTACIISTVLIYSRASRTTTTSRTSELQKHASNTIIFITLLYIVLNIPVVVLCVLYTIVFVNNHVYHHVFNTQFLYWYSWSCVYILGVALNANLNPVIYIWRMNNFRGFVVTLGRETPVPVVKSTTYANRSLAGNGSGKGRDIQMTRSDQVNLDRRSFTSSRF